MVESAFVEMGWGWGEMRWDESVESADCVESVSMQTVQAEDPTHKYLSQCDT